MNFAKLYEALQNNAICRRYPYLLFCQIIQDIEITLNEDLKSASLWFNDILNYSKSKFVLFGSSRRLKFFNNISIIVNQTPLSVLLGTTMLFPNTLTAHFSSEARKHFSGFAIKLE